jgi:hypothetical protein
VNVNFIIKSAPLCYLISGGDVLAYLGYIIPHFREFERALRRFAVKMALQTISTCENWLNGRK